MASDKAIYWLALAVFALGLSNSYEQGSFARVHQLADHAALSVERAAENGLSKITMAEVMMGWNPLQITRLQAAIARLEARDAMREAQSAELAAARQQMSDLRVQLRNMRSAAAGWKCNRHEMEQAKIAQQNEEVSEPSSDLQLSEVVAPEIDVQVPEVHVPAIDVPQIHIPEIHVPQIHVKVPRVDVRAPQFAGRKVMVDNEVMVNDTQIDLSGLPGMESLKSLESLKGLSSMQQLQALRAMDSMRMLDCPHEQVHIHVHTPKPHTTI